MGSELQYSLGSLYFDTQLQIVPLQTTIWRSTVELGDFALAGECSCLTIDLTRGWFPRQNYCHNVHIELIPPVTIITKGNLQFANMRWIDYSCRGRDSFSKTIQARTGVQVIMVHKLAQTYLLHTLPQVETS